MSINRTAYSKGRVRLDDAMGWVLSDLVDREIRRMTTSRAEARDTANPDLIRLYNRRLAALRRLEEEVYSTGVEMGWWPRDEVRAVVP